MEEDHDSRENSPTNECRNTTESFKGQIAKFLERYYGMHVEEVDAVSVGKNSKNNEQNDLGHKSSLDIPHVLVHDGRYLCLQRPHVLNHVVGDRGKDIELEQGEEDIGNFIDQRAGGAEDVVGAI